MTMTTDHHPDFAANCWCADCGATGIDRWHLCPDNRFAVEAFRLVLMLIGAK